MATKVILMTAMVMRVMWGMAKVATYSMSSLPEEDAANTAV